MSVHKLTAGDGYTYLTRQVAASDSTERGRASLSDYYAEKGEAPGRWVGAGLPGVGLTCGEVVGEDQMVFLFGAGRHPNTGEALGRPFPVYDSASSYRSQVAVAFAGHNTGHGLDAHAPVSAEVRAQIRTEVARQMFTDKHRRAPVDARELSGFIAQVSRQPSAAVAGYDLTFSPVKSISTLWALAPREVAEQIQAAHWAAVEETVGWLERDVAFTRVGSGGIRQVVVRGLLAAAFTHRDSRAGDPDLHTHVAVSNKVQTHDGRWFALDGRVLYAAAVTASERYNTRLEAELVDRLGVRFAARGAPDGKRAVREIVGVNDLLNRHWSSRRCDIEARQSELATGFQSRHGRPPTAVEAVTLAQQATLETRDARHEPRSQAVQRSLWRQEAAKLLGSDREVDFMIDEALGHRTPALPATSDWMTACAATVIGVLEEHRATWRVWHVRAEAERQARAAGLRLGDLDTAVDQVVDRALASSLRLGAPDPVPEPAALRRPDGVSVYDVHGATLYTSTRVLAAEQRLLATAGQGGGRSVAAIRVATAIARETAHGITLNPAQAAMVSELATCGARLQLALAPAGTGKTTAMRVLARAWTDDGGYVLGLAPSARAAAELGEAIDGRTETLAKLTWTLRHQPRSQWPGWMDRIGPRTLVVIDEAGQAGTNQLVTAVDFIVARGGSVRLIGDDQQLAAVGAGGILRDIDRTLGAVRLTEVRRFHNPAEAAATLAIRDGDPTGLGFYADHRRIHVGGLGAVADQAYRSWAADRAAGLDSVLLAATRETVTGLNERARADRLATRRTPLGRQVRLADGTRASAGDTILTRRNERRLVTSSSNWVKNGDRWTVQQVHPDGSMRVRHVDSRRSVTLPAGYVAEHVQLGYAATVHTAQGMTCDTSHLVVTGDEPRQLLYVGLSRGRQANHVYLGHESDGDVGSLLRPEAVRPPTAIEILSGVLERDGAQHSATTIRHELDSPATQLKDAMARYRDALGDAAEEVLGSQALASLNQQVDAILPGLTSEPAYPTLRAHLALAAVSGADPLNQLLDAAAGRPLGTADDRAAVLDWRLDNHGAGQGPLPWLPAVPPALAASPDWGIYLQTRTDRVTDLTQQVRRDLITRLPLDTPAWASDITAAGDPELRADLAVWRAAFGVDATDDTPTGPPQPGSDAAAHQTHLNRRLRHAVEETATPGAWRTVLPEIVLTDTYAEKLQRRLTLLNRGGINPTALIENALAQPQPLPVEHAAGALWWRVVSQVDPAALRQTGTSPYPQSQPSPKSRWAGQLTEAVPGIDTNPGWAMLLKHIGRIHADGYDVPQILTGALATPLPPNERAADDLRYRIMATTGPGTRQGSPPRIATAGQPPADSRHHQTLQRIQQSPRAPRR